MSNRRPIMHAAWLGPFYWDWRCRICDREVSLHASFWERMFSKVRNRKKDRRRKRAGPITGPDILNVRDRMGFGEDEYWVWIQHSASPEFLEKKAKEIRDKEND